MKFKKDFTDVYTSVDVEEAASRLTEKLVEVLDKHAPWIIFQQRKNFSPWITGETLELMKQRDKLKEKVKAKASRDGRHISAEQTELWEEYKEMRNKINNRTRQEETNFQRSKVQECQDSPSKSWGTAKKYIGW